jgi:hypothetical protein
LEKIANEADIQRIHADLGRDLKKIRMFPALPFPLGPTSYRRRIAQLYDVREPREILDGDAADLMMNPFGPHEDSLILRRMR